MIEVPHNRISAYPEEADAVAATVLSGRWSSFEKVGELEGLLRARTERRHAICVDSGLSALRLSLLAHGVAAGDRVLVPAYSCVALANACLSVGADPVEVDVREGTWDIDGSSLKEDERAKIAIAVDTFGVPAALEEFEERGITVVEDCAHALGVDVGERPLGNRSPVAVTSFHATKLIGVGEGGAVFTDDDEIAERVRWYRDYADKPADGRMLNCQMSNIEAALGVQRMHKLPDLLTERRSIAEEYLKAFATLAKEGVIALPSRHNETWYRFALKLERVDADAAISGLRERGVEAARPVEDWRRYPNESPVATLAYRRLLSLPIFPGLMDSEQSAVVQTVTLEAERW